MRRCTIHPRISIDPTVCHGQACIKGTRIPVHQIMETQSRSFWKSILHSNEDILTGLDYAESLAEGQVTPIEALASAA